MKFSILTGPQVRSQHFDQTMAIAREVFPEHYCAKRETLLRWQKQNPNIFILLKDNEKDNIAGYAYALPIKGEQFEEFIEGKLSDKSIVDAGPVPYKKSGEYYLYLATVALRKTYQDTGAYFVLRKGIDDYIDHLRSRGFNIVDMVAETITTHGIKVAEHSKMKLVAMSPDNHPVYVKDIRSAKALSAG